MDKDRLKGIEDRLLKAYEEKDSPTPDMLIMLDFYSNAPQDIYDLVNYVKEFVK